MTPRFHVVTCVASYRDCIGHAFSFLAPQLGVTMQCNMLWSEAAQCTVKWLKYLQSYWCRGYLIWMHAYWPLRNQICKVSDSQCRGYLIWKHAYWPLRNEICKVSDSLLSKFLLLLHFSREVTFPVTSLIQFSPSENFCGYRTPGSINIVDVDT